MGELYFTREGLNGFFGIAVTGAILIFALVSVFVFGIALIIAGTIMQKKNFHKKIAVALKIIGYFITVPVIFVILLFAAFYVFKV